MSLSNLIRPFSLVALCLAAANAAVITSQALTSDEVSDSISGQGAFLTGPTSGAPAIEGISTEIVTGIAGGSAPSVMTFRVAGAGVDFTYDLVVSAYASEGGVESLVSRRNNSGRVMPDSTLGGEHRQRIDSPDTVGAGNWEFVRLSVENVVVISGAPINLLGFRSVRLDGLAAGDDGNIEDVSTDAILSSWVGGDGSSVVDLTANYSNSIDLVATGNSGGNNANRPTGFAVDFSIVPEPSPVLYCGALLFAIAIRRNRR